jgi:hypothetical protein
LAIVVSPSEILVGDAASDQASNSGYAGASVARFFDPDLSKRSNVSGCENIAV